MAGATPRGLAGWVRHHIPTREAIARNRLLRPVAHRILAPSLWRFNRRSVPRGVALGLFCGVIFPFAHMLLAALLALPLRANVPTAVGATLSSNPVTIGPMLWAAYRIGHWLLRLDRDVPGRPAAHAVAGHVGMLHWLLAQGGPATALGLVVLAIGMAAAGYALATLAWRWRTARRWRSRAGARR